MQHSKCCVVSQPPWVQIPALPPLPPGPNGAGRFCYAWMVCGHASECVCWGRAAWCARGRRATWLMVLLVVPSVFRVPSGPAAREIATREPTARSGRSRSPPWPSGPSGTLHTGGACVAVCGWARRLEARPGPAPPTGTAAWPSVPSGTLHTGGACVAVTSPARPYRMGTAAWVSGLSTQWCPVADADWCVVSKPGQALPPPTGTAAWPSGPSTPAALVSLCVAGCVVSKPGQASPRPWAPQPGPPCPPAPSIPASLVSL